MSVRGSKTNLSPTLAGKEPARPSRARKGKGETGQIVPKKALLEGTPFTASSMRKEDRLLVSIIADASNSMGDHATNSEGKKIDVLNRGIARFIDKLKQDSLITARVELSFISLPPVERIVAPTMLQELTVPTIGITKHGQGGTPLCEAIAKSLDLAEQRKAEYKAQQLGYYQPIHIVITDGEMTDGGGGEFEALEARIAALDGRKASRVYGLYMKGHGPMSHTDEDHFVAFAKFSKLLHKQPLAIDGPELDEAMSWFKNLLTATSKTRATSGGQDPTPEIAEPNFGESLQEIIDRAA